MKHVRLMYLKGCPHCHKALRLLEEVKREHPEYQNMEIEMIEEQEHPEIANDLDYWYVPTFYVDGVKLHEGRIHKKDVENVLAAALL